MDQVRIQHPPSFASLTRAQGKVAEFDSPQNLIDNKSSIFYSLATEAGLT
jgi:hypothetical protein